MKSKSKLMFFGVVLAAAAAVAAQDVVKVEWKPAVGQKNRYKLEVAAAFDFGGQKADMNFGMIQTFEVKKVEDGKITVESKSSDMTLFVGGQDMSSMMGSMDFTTTTVQNANGETLEVKTNAPTSEGQARLEQAYVLFYPNKEMKVGDTWSRKVKADSAKGYVDAEAVYKLEAVETVDKYKTLKITYEYNEKSGEAPIKATGTFWIDSVDGNLVKGDFKMKNVVFDPSMPPTDATAKINKIG